MSNKQPKDIAAELAYQAEHAGEVQKVTATPPETVRLYREHKQWRTSAKQYIFHLIDQCRPGSICEFGCGLGETCTELALNGYQVFGFDLSPEAIAVCRRRAELDNVAGRTQFIVAAAGDASLPKGSFDLVLVRAVLHHLDLDEGLAGVEALAKPGGWIIIQEPVAYSGWLRWLRDRTPVERDISPNERQLNQQDLRAITARFEVMETRHFYLFGRLIRLCPFKGAIEKAVVRLLQMLDYAVMMVPGVSHFSGMVILLCRRRG